MQCFGNSMLPMLKSGSTLTFEKRNIYNIGDIVFYKINGRYIDSHKITKIYSDGRCMIANNHGYENGCTKTIYAKAIKSVHGLEEKEL